VYLIPMGWLSLLPLHAARSPEGAYFCDDFETAYVPSARALLAARQRPLPAAAASLLAVENPVPPGNLAYAADEVRVALTFFEQAQRFAGAEAARARILEALESSDVLHFATHGYADFARPLHSGLLAARGETLTIEDFFAQRLTRPQLAALSACETAVPPELKSPDEIISLPTSLMVAGIPTVIGSLWSVDDVSTAILMARFYELWRGERQEPLQALLAAQRWLRTSTTKQLKEHFKKDLPQFAHARLPEQSAEAFFQEVSLQAGDDERPFEHPFYWAAFTYTGL
jgi:CHAT domain-containing protein